MLVCISLEMHRYASTMGIMRFFSGLYPHLFTWDHIGPILSENMDLVMINIAQMHMNANRYKCVFQWELMHGWMV